MADQEPDEEKVIELNSRLTTLIQFAATMIDDLPVLKKVAGQSTSISNHILTIAPVISALGGDFEEEHMEAEVKRKRALALVSLIETLKDTEKERTAFKESQVARKEALSKLSGLGIF